MCAAEWIAVRARGGLMRRLDWLAQSADVDDPTAEAHWRAQQPRDEGDVAADALAGKDGALWDRLTTVFGLAPAESELLQLAIAVAVEPALGPLVAAAQGTPSQYLPTEALAKRLAALPPRPIWRPTGPLAMWALVRPVAGMPGTGTGFEADPRIVDWLFGAVSLDLALVLGVAPVEPRDAPSEWPVAATIARLERAQAVGPTRLVVTGREGAGRRHFASAVVNALGRTALLVDPAALTGPDWAENFMRLQRFALFSDAALIWRSGASAWPAKVALARLQCVCVDHDDAPPRREGLADIVVRLPETSVATKAALWQSLAPQLAEASQIIATMPGVSLDDLEQAARVAPATIDEATAQLRTLARSRMRGIGRVIDPIYGWDDLILDAGVERLLRRIAFEARSRAHVLEAPDAARQFAGAAALTALFAGPPGVGKSTAAQVIARDLGVNLLVVDLAATTSKYIGETAKNLSQAFACAREAGAALIFEEADALFARRTDVKDSTDRHANADTGHLLQLMEAHDGIVILSTNRRANLDPAFIRRIRHTVDFDRPRAAERERVWRLAVTALGAAALDTDTALAALAALAERHDLTPAQIKSAALRARYTAHESDRAMTLDDLVDGAASELVKEGRTVLVDAVTPLRRPRTALRG